MSKVYKKFKPQLREEFSYACAYCGTREPEAGGAKVFGIDHYKPKLKFPELIDDYVNLIYSCPKCNGYKGDYWPNLIAQLCEQFVLNPRNDTLSHIDKSSTTWKGLTKCGHWNIAFLHLSDKAQVGRRNDRKVIEKTIEETIKIREKYEENLKMIKLSENEIQEHEEKIEDLNVRIEVFKRKIEGPMD